MSITKHEIPILEHDSDPKAVLMPGHDSGVAREVPRKLVYAFLLDEIEKYAERNGCEKLGELKTITKAYPVYRAEYRGQQLCLCQAPLGASAAVQLMDDLIARGARDVIAVGSCGALLELPENEFLIPERAMRDEGASYHYLPPARWATLHADAISAIERALDKSSVKHERVSAWTTDGFFRETKRMVTYRRQEGCAVVDMECAGLAACAEFRGVRFGQILFTADTLADIERYDARDWGYGAFGIALKLAMDAAVEL